MKRILVCGGRDYADRERVFSVLDKCLAFYGAVTIIHGAAPGADSLANGWAEQREVPIEPYPADWKQYGKRAGFIRNSKMLNEGHPDLVIAFPGGAGTDMMVKLAIAGNVQTLRLPNIPKKE